MSGAGWLKTRVFQPRVWVMCDQVLVSGVNFLTLVYLGRELAPESFGLFTLAYLSVIFLGTLQTALMTQPLNLIGAVKDESVNLGHLVSLQRLHVYVWLPMNAVVLGGISFLFFPKPGLYIAAAVYLCAFQLQQLLRRYWYTCDRIDRAFGNDAIGCGAQAVGLLLLGRQGFFDEAWAFYALALASFLAVAVGWRRLRRQPRIPMPLRAVVAEHWSFGGWLLLVAFSSYAATQLYPYMLASQGAGMVATFAASVNILNGLNVLVQAANNYLPIKARQLLQRDGLEGMWRFLARVGLKIFAAASIFCAVVAFWADDLLRLIYGENFVGSDNVLRILAVGALGWTLFPVLYAGILALGRAPVVVVSNMVATLFIVTAGWWLIRHYGVEGAAVAASASVMLILFVQAWSLKSAAVKFTPGPVPARQGSG